MSPKRRSGADSRTTLSGATTLFTKVRRSTGTMRRNQSAWCNSYGLAWPRQHENIGTSPYAACGGQRIWDSGDVDQTLADFEVASDGSTTESTWKAAEIRRAASCLGLNWR